MTDSELLTTHAAHEWEEVRVTAKWQVPPGDRVEDHYCGRCENPWDWCLCEADDEGDDE